MILFCISMMYKYFIRFRDVPNNRILLSAIIKNYLKVSLKAGFLIWLG